MLRFLSDARFFRTLGRVTPSKRSSLSTSGSLGGGWALVVTSAGGSTGEDTSTIELRSGEGVWGCYLVSTSHIKPS